MSKVKMELVELDYETPAMRIHKKEKQIRANRRIESRERTHTFKHYRDKEIAPYIRYFSRSRKWYEKIGNKRVRGSKELYQRGAYKKVYDLWWEYD